MSEVSPNSMDQQPSAARRLALDLGLYTLARLGLVVVIAAVIAGVGKIAGVGIPLLVALIFAIVIAMPISMIAFKSLRARVNVDIAAVDERRRRDKAELRARLRGDVPPESRPE